ncbi:hypothetical protein CAG96_07655 [Campylobacter coli]|uniref:hypothetical protein n=1 Tax=Campylobacter coli TaxID=195 RepID=UPI001388FA1A|nr:hypothetical protein [Campylobacter coli]EAH5999082.1 hypothetical protein [Campylobacter coli]EAJ0357605.1 hypothetical protein [Campylobacter coli]EAJ0478939.1 hypothetical protein [Campylobacter coli]EAK2251622.1 hypothetical protein [Campylobacter coli]ECZ8636452.1 hypothetical protein [Campylobacter coli]
MIKIYVEGKSDKIFLDLLCKNLKIDEFETIYPHFITCFKEYSKCLKDKGTILNEKELNKNLIYAYNQACGSGTKEICLDHYDLDHEYIKPLIDFLKA